MSAPTNGTGPVQDRLRERAWARIAAARKPMTVEQLAERAGLTKGGALTFLREWASTRRVVRLPTAGHPAPYLDQYATPALLTSLNLNGSQPVNSPPITPPARTEQVGAAPAPVVDPFGLPVPGGTLLTAALGYAARGWHVFPLRPNDKRPAFPAHPESICTGSDARCARAGRHVTWQERATTDPGRIRAAWSRTAYGIGIACGPSGLVVLDLDTPKPDPTGALPAPPPVWAEPGISDGTDVLAALCGRGGYPFPVGGTYSVRTGRGGLHLYFTHPDGARLRNTAGELGWLIDTRAHGGYVVAPPSTAQHRPYMVELDAPVRPLPVWLTTALTPRPLPVQEPVTVHLEGVSDRRRRAYLEAALDRCAAAVRESGDGQHNKALYGAAVQLGQLVAGGELRPATVTAALLPAALAVGQSETETHRTITSGLKAGANRARTITTKAAAA